MSDSLDSNSNPGEDLAFIKKVMEDSRRMIEYNGFYFVLWGGLCLIGTGLSYLLGALGKPHLITYIWLVLWLGGFFTSFTAIRRSGKRVKSFSSTLIGAIWGCLFLLCLIIVGATAMTGALTLPFCMAITSGVIAAGVLMSAAVSRSRYLALLSIPWWIGGIGIGMLPSTLAPLALALLTLFFEFIPGLIMYLRWSNHNHEREA